MINSVDCDPIPTLRPQSGDKQREHGFNVAKAELYLEGYCPGCGDKEKTVTSRTWGERWSI